MPGLPADPVARGRRVSVTPPLAACLCALLLAAGGVVAGTADEDVSRAAHDTTRGTDDARRPSPGAGNRTAVHPLVPLALDDTRLAFSALGRDWEIALEPREILSPSARAELSDMSLPRLFGGRVIGDERSWVRLARDGDRLSGHLFTEGTLYRIEPPTGARGTGYRLVRVGAGAADLVPPAIARASDDAPDVSRAMRVGIVVDSRYDEYHEGRGLSRALAVMNGVDGLYREQLGLAVVVERVRVHDDPASDPMRTRGGTIEDVLTAFRGVRLGDPGLPGDLALVHLFSGHAPADDVIGLGWIDTVCRLDGYDVSMSTPFAFDTLLSAHEIAHNLGALHDEDPRCEADPSGTGSGLMEERLSSDTVTDFSACSLDRLRRRLGADCLVDSLDLALGLDVSPGATPAERRVDVRVTNADPFRTARAVRSRTRLPDGARVSETSEGCAVDGALLVCEHGDVAPSAADTATVTLALRGGSGGTEAIATLDPGTFVDSDATNDRVVLDLLESAAGDGLPADDSPTAVASAPSAPADANGGAAGDVAAGGTGLPLLAWLAALAIGRARYRLRSTEYKATLSSASR